MQMFWKTPRMWEGSTVYIIGGGPSLKGVDLSVLAGLNVIGCNDAYLLGKWVGVVYFGDAKWYDLHYKQLIKHPGILVTCNEEVHQRKELPGNLKILRRHGDGCFTQPFIGWCGNTGISAINLAAQLGAKKIVLLGFDMKMQGSESNWHPNPLSLNSNASYERFMTSAAAMALGLEKVYPDVEVVNANLDSALNLWPKRDRNDVLAEAAATTPRATPFDVSADECRKPVVPFSVITCTRDRPNMLKLCTEYMKRQTVHPAEWIIVDDGDTPVTPPDLPFVVYVRRQRQENDPAHTLGVNTLAGLKHARQNIVSFFEDDDWYHPQYLEVTSRYIQRFDVVGQKESPYYRLKRREYHFHKDTQHASMFTTTLKGMRPRQLLEFVIKENTSTPYHDLNFWRACRGKFRTHLFVEPTVYAFGIKEHCDFQGTTSGWNGKSNGYVPDPDLESLYRFIGQDIHLYKEML